MANDTSSRLVSATSPGPAAPPVALRDPGPLGGPGDRAPSSGGGATGASQGAAADATAVTWLGHASALAELGGARLLFDPLGRRRARRAGAVDAVLITHAHVDHLNRWTLKAVPRSAHLVVPRGAAPIVADLGFARVTEVTAGDQLELAGVEIEAVPTRHDTGRWRKTPLPECVGYVVRAAAPGAPALHHAGDVDFSDHRIFDALGKRFALATALLPVGGMMPVWYYRMRRRALDRGVHIDPDCALDIFERLGAQRLVPVHWGTLNLRLGPPSMPRRRLEAQAHERQLSSRVAVLGHGERLTLR
jgi:L-ascorbate metabolism protein UlaG (beta-lactamase superfamily)